MIAIGDGDPRPSYVDTKRERLEAVKLRRAEVPEISRVG